MYESSFEEQHDVRGIGVSLSSLAQREMAGRVGRLEHDASDSCRSAPARVRGQDGRCIGDQSRVLFTGCAGRGGCDRNDGLPRRGADRDAVCGLGSDYQALGMPEDPSPGQTMMTESGPYYLLKKTAELLGVDLKMKAHMVEA